jgi:DNA replication and repair protein RecF
VKLVRLGASRFRNLAPLGLELDARFTVFFGRNAQGKTNLLEAIYLLSTLKPLRARRARELVQFDETTCEVAGIAEHQGITRRYTVEIADGRRSARLDDKPAPTLVDYFLGLRAIAFVPGDTQILGGEPARRRAWLDRAAFTAAPTHLDAVSTYRRVLEQKAAALREQRPDSRVLDALDVAVAEHGGRLAHRRAALLAELGPHAERVHQTIALGRGRLDLAYRTEATGTDPAQRAASLAQRLAATRDREVQRRMTLVGPHLDDLEVSVDGRSLRQFGSQGQVRSAVLSMKIAEMHAASARGDVPLFLFDDVGSELDPERKVRLVESLYGIGAQVFLTTTDLAHLEGLPASETASYEVDSGIVTRR